MIIKKNIKMFYINSAHSQNKSAYFGREEVYIVISYVLYLSSYIGMYGSHYFN